MTLTLGGGGGGGGGGMGSKVFSKLAGMCQMSKWRHVHLKGKIRKQEPMRGWVNKLCHQDDT